MMVMQMKISFALVLDALTNDFGSGGEKNIYWSFVKDIVTTEEPHLTEGDIVVVYSEDQQRSLWKLGKIERIFQGADAQQRAATVLVSKNGCMSTLDRPIRHLYPLEVVSHNFTSTQSDSSLEDAQRSSVLTSDGDSCSTGSRRPRRSTADRARDRILTQAVTE